MLMSWPFNEQSRCLLDHINKQIFHCVYEQHLSTVDIHCIDVKNDIVKVQLGIYSVRAGVIRVDDNYLINTDQVK